jgi:spore coat protein A
MHNRRDFLKMAALAGAGLSFANCGGYPGSGTFAQSPLLRKFIAPLPGLGGTGIPIASANTTLVPGADVYNLTAGAYSQLMHPDLPKATNLWGYSDQATGKFVYLGPIISAQRGRPAIFNIKNNLPAVHPLPVDTSLMGADMGAAQNRMTIHLHGGLVPWTSDGGPFSWFTPTGTSGATDGSAGTCFLNGVAGQPGTAQYYYPNNQSARLMWYHDHAIGLTRLNAYAGLASGYLLTDPVVTGLVNAGIVPSLTYTVPLIIQDKIFKPVADQWGRAGDLWYPYHYAANATTDANSRWDLGPASNGFSSKGLPQDSSCVPELFADTPVLNGMAYPYLQVQPRRYRFVLLNGSQARFYNLNLFYESVFESKEPDFSKPGPGFIQIGTEGGLLPAPVVLNSPPH